MVMRVDNEVENLRVRIKAVEEELRGLHALLANAEKTVSESTASLGRPIDYETGVCSDLRKYGKNAWRCQLDAEEYKRYGRQMILPEVGIDGQLRLRARSVLVVGIGGLGCPAAQYLAGAGIGKIGLIDGDTVELSNLHRQTLHSTRSIGQYKVESARDRLIAINPSIQYVTYKEHLQPDRAYDLFVEYDLILDCTDNPESRYLISDAAELASKTVVSASALKTEGQLLVLNNPPMDKHSMCYRCVFPKPPPPGSVTSCGESGILGPVVGVMGALMATEALKILLPRYDLSNGLKFEPSKTNPVMLLYSALSHQPFRTVRLRGRRKDCASCSENRSITLQSLKSGSLDYTKFCGVQLSTEILDPETERVTAKEFQRILAVSDNPGAHQHILVDVREKPHFDLAHLMDTINVPFSEIRHDPEQCLENIHVYIDSRSNLKELDISIYLICRFGNDSQVAMKDFQDAATRLITRKESQDAETRSRLAARPKRQFVADVKGGLDAWRREVDPRFPDF